ncbi:O-methyltransferase [Amycolatopsis sp. NPDC049868]|uniref:O-methyltransferase n=1 Tax=Amycolatopsis sp. NPDC049868 TaxID=3363934 RepID=UPI0037928AEB
MRLTSRIVDYVLAQVAPPTAAEQRLIDDTTALGGIAEMQIPHEQGALLTLLAKLVDARTIVEVGTFTGYSTLALAKGVAPGGVVLTHDISSDWSELATRAWKEAGVADRIQQRIGPAAPALAGLPEEPFIDLAFIDADKVGYLEYWELLVPRMAENGLILVDNVLYAGEAADEDATGNAKAIQEVNAHIRADERVESVLLAISDGLTIARKKRAREFPGDRARAEVTP